MSKIGSSPAPTPVIGPNDVFRFALELAALAALAWWGATRVEGTGASIALGVAVPTIAAALWATFRVPNDPKPNPPVQVPGPLRLLLEAAFFAASVAATGAQSLPLAFGFAVVLLAHYAIAHRRVSRLLRNLSIA